MQDPGVSCPSWLHVVCSVQPGNISASLFISRLPGHMLAICRSGALTGNGQLEKLGTCRLKEGFFLRHNGTYCRYAVRCTYLSHLVFIIVLCTYCLHIDSSIHKNANAPEPRVVARGYVTDF